MFANKSRTFATLLRTIKECFKDDRLRSNIPDYVATFNALSLPRGYVYVDPDDLVHIVFINNRLREDTLDRSTFGMQAHWSADVVWYFDAVTGIWTIRKDRTGDFESLCPIKCGGMPEVKPNV